jgi:hypothetical protein
MELKRKTSSGSLFVLVSFYEKKYKIVVSSFDERKVIDIYQRYEETAKNCDYDINWINLSLNFPQDKSCQWIGIYLNGTEVINASFGRKESDLSEPSTKEKCVYLKGKLDAIIPLYSIILDGEVALVHIGKI